MPSSDQPALVTTRDWLATGLVAMVVAVGLVLALLAGPAVPPLRTLDTAGLSVTT